MLNMNKLSIKCQSYPKSTKIHDFEQKICLCHNHSQHSLNYILVLVYSIKKLQNGQQKFFPFCKKLQYGQQKFFFKIKNKTL